MKTIKISDKLWAIIVKKTKAVNDANPGLNLTPGRWAALVVKASFDPYIGTGND